MEEGSKSFTAKILVKDGIVTVEVPDGVPPLVIPNAQALLRRGVIENDDKVSVHGFTTKGNDDHEYIGHVTVVR
ncbi:MAG: hypothetical protein ACYST0_11065 [Planctomycetota bacterium]